MEAPQGVELTGTNRPSGLTHTSFEGCVKQEMFAFTVRFPGHGRELTTPRTPGLIGVSVVMAKGKHPVPFRTRKLSPSAPMVLRGRPRGRVGHRRAQPRTTLRPAPHPGE